MKTIFDDAHGYLNSSIRTYVNATKTIDKLFAFKLVVLSMIVAVDRLIENMGTNSDTPFRTHIEDSSFFIPMAAYEQRMRDLMTLEEKNKLPSDLELSQRLHRALDILKVVYEKYGLRPLLAVNIKEFINESQFFILDIKNLLEKQNTKIKEK
ncbi:MAG: hypothetical protein ACFE95_06835 [Candidatus Hodarchaeota archaeon]